ncbi:MAG: TlpA disulfide reductase family protein [Myxococcota bacterium]|nr:TlpA disulfide reductase family protein [Myxococcota bacterium]
MRTAIGRTLSGVTLIFAMGCVQNSSNGAIPNRSAVEDETAAYAKTTTDADALSKWSSHLAALELFSIQDKKVITSSAARFSVLGNENQNPFLVQFFATYCPPCIKEIPSFNEMAKRGTRVIGVSLDVSNHDGLIELIEQHPTQYPVYVMTPASLEAFSQPLEGLPMTMLVKDKAHVLAVIIGQISTPELESWLAKYPNSSKNPSQK